MPLFCSILKSNSFDYKQQNQISRTDFLRIGVQSAIEEMERLEQKDDATPEELEALAQELSGKMLLTTWKATRWEVINVSLHLVLTRYPR